MSKEKFERSQSWINIGDIKNVEHGKTMAGTAMRMAQESYEKYVQMVLQDLINEYGEEEGKKRFEMLKQDAVERYNALQNISSTREKREDGVNIPRKR